MIDFDKIFQRVEQLYLKLFRSAEEILPGILLILLSLLISLIVEYVVRILVRMMRVNRLIERSSIIHALSDLGIKPRSHIYVGKIFFWITFLILLEASAEVSGWESITSRFNEYAELIPLLIGAAIITTLGLFTSKFIRDLMRGVLTRAGSKTSTIISNITYYALIALTLTIVLGHMGFDTTIITANVSIVLGSILFAFSLAFVFASKDLLSNILASSYNKSLYKVGQQVVIDKNEGEIIKITNTAVYVKSATKIRVIPAKKFTEEIVEIVGWTSKVPESEE